MKPINESVLHVLEEMGVGGQQSIPDTIQVDGKERPTRNSKGKLIHPTTEGIENFWKWFGDSKVVDGQGSPVVVYHGTKRNFSEFTKDKIATGSGDEGHFGFGFYFSFYPREASFYGDRLVPAYVSIKKPFYGKDFEYDLLKDNGIDWIEEKEDMSIEYKSLKRAVDKKYPVMGELLGLIHEHGYEKGYKEWSKNNHFTDLGDEADTIYDIYRAGVVEGGVEGRGIPEWVYDNIKELGLDGMIKFNKGFYFSPQLNWITDLGNNARAVTDVMKRLGYDGVVYGSEIVAFSPTQIKSATGNSGTFNPSSNKISEGHQ